MEEPDLVTLIPEEEPEAPPPPPPELGKKIIVQMVMIVCLKVATGLVIKNLVKSIRQFDVMYPEHLGNIRWKEES